MSPDSPHPKPDIILMDVQMPIIDGYTATHLLRHHAPYKQLSRHIPIVAMTASAIQGDREKCEQAGMDDYLAKPVKSKTLEKMLVRWTVNRRVPPTRPGGADDDGNECAQPEEHNCGTAAVPMFGQGKPGAPGKEPESALELLRPTTSERQNSHRLTLPGTESEGERAEMREEAEEKATALRDEKLVGAAGVSGDGLIPHSDTRDPGQKLTVENVGRLEKEAKSRSPRRVDLRRDLSPVGGSSISAEHGTPERTPERKPSDERPQIERRWRDSERTIRGP